MGHRGSAKNLTDEKRRCKEVRERALESGMLMGQEILELIAAEDQVTLAPGDQAVAFELDEEFGDARPRGAHQVGQILVPRSDGEADAALVFGAEVLAQFEQNQGQPLL